MNRGQAAGEQGRCGERAGHPLKAVTLGNDSMSSQPGDTVLGTHDPL